MIRWTWIANSISFESRYFTTACRGDKTYREESYTCVLDLRSEQWLRSAEKAA